MSVFLSKEVLEGLEMARKRRLKKDARLRVHVGDEVYPILKFDTKTFSVDADNAPHLRGLVDIYDGSRHLYQALIVASNYDGDHMVFEFKRNTMASTQPARDFSVEDDAPVAFIPSF